LQRSQSLVQQVLLLEPLTLADEPLAQLLLVLGEPLMLVLAVVVALVEPVAPLLYEYSGESLLDHRYLPRKWDSMVHDCVRVHAVDA
jgi:hypothetical protein